MTQGNLPYFYVYSPPWRNNAAGVKVLYLLCDALNKLGVNSWLVFSSNGKTEEMPPHLTNLDTPVLTRKILAKHKKMNVDVVTIYSETVPGNPMRSNKIIRYLMHFPGALGGPEVFHQDELLVAYSKAIQEATEGCEDILFLPAVDLVELPTDCIKVPGLKVGYAGKYRGFAGVPRLPNKEEFVEIFRDGPKRQSRMEVLALLGMAEMLYVWENSSIVVESLLLNTPVLFVPNPHMGPLIATYELGKNGMAYDFSKEEIAFAKESVFRFKDDYIIAQGNFHYQLVEILEKSINYWKNQESNCKNIKMRRMSSVFHHYLLAKNIYQSKGLAVLIRMVYEFGFKKMYSIYFRFR
jgi:hypothetical protein